MKTLKSVSELGKGAPMTHTTVGLHPRKTRHLALALLRTGSQLLVDGTRVGSLLGLVGDDPAVARALLDAGSWAEEQGVRVLALAARVEAWEAEGRLPPGVTGWHQSWDDAFGDPVQGHRAAQTALVAWREGDRELFLRLMTMYGSDPVFAVTVVASLSADALVGPLSERWLGLTGRPAGPGDPQLVAALGAVLATGSTVGIGPRPRELADALDRVGVPAAALGLLVAGSPVPDGRPFETGWLVELGTVVLPGVGVSIRTGGTGDRLGAASSGADLLPPEWAGDLRVPVLEAIAADPVASARILATLPLGTLLPAAAEIPSRGTALAAVVRSAAAAPAADRASAATEVVGEIGSAPPGTPFHDPVLVAAVELVAPYLDALRPPELVGGGYPPRSLPVGPLDASRFVTRVAASDAAAGALAAVSDEWLRRELPIVTALPDPVLGLRLLGGTAGMIAVSVEDGRCERADDSDDLGENAATASAILAFAAAALSRSSWGTATTVVGMKVGDLLDPGVDHSARCREDLQAGEAVRSAALGLWVIDETWANRGANRLFSTEGGDVPAPPREVLDDTGDHLRDHLDTHRLGLLSEWLKQPAVVTGLPGVDAFRGSFAAAAPPR
jgi:hypothetical protein